MIAIFACKAIREMSRRDLLVKVKYEQVKCNTTTYNTNLQIQPNLSVSGFSYVSLCIIWESSTPTVLLLFSPTTHVFLCCVKAWKVTIWRPGYFCLSWDGRLQTKVNPPPLVWLQFSEQTWWAVTRILKENSGISPFWKNSYVYQPGSSPSSLSDSDGPLPSPGREAGFCLSCCQGNSTGFRMFMGTLIQRVSMGKVWYLTVKALVGNLGVEGGSNQKTFFCCLCAGHVCV